MEPSEQSTQPSSAPLTLTALIENEMRVMNLLYMSGGEITPEIEAMLRISEKSLPQKVDGYSHMLDRLQIESERIAHVAEQYEKMQSSLVTAIEWMKNTLRDSMRALEVEELVGIDRKFRLQKAQPKLEVNTAELPAIYMREEVVHKQDTDRIKRELAAGQTIPGCRLVESYYVRSYAHSVARVGEKKSKATKQKKEIQ